MLHAKHIIVLLKAPEEGKKYQIEVVVLNQGLGSKVYISKVDSESAEAKAREKADSLKHRLKVLNQIHEEELKQARRRQENINKAIIVDIVPEEEETEIELNNPAETTTAHTI